MDLAPPPVVNSAIRAVLDRGDLGYNFDALFQLPKAFCNWQAEHHGWQPDEDQVVHFNTVLHAIEVILWQATNRGDGVLLMTPIYPPFLAAVKESGLAVVGCPLDPETGAVTAEGIEAALARGSAAGHRVSTILLCNPHNPTGRVFNRSELEAVADSAESHDLLVISDEVWSDLVHAPEESGGRSPIHVPFATISERAAARTVTVFGASKSFNLAGMRVAVAHVGSERVAKAVKALPAHILGGTNVLGAEATLACWRSGQPWLKETKAHLRAQRDHLARRLATELPAVGFRVPEATYLAWLDFRALDLGADPKEFFLEHARVALGTGPRFGDGGQGFARLNFATTRLVLDEIVDRIVASVDR